MKLNVDGNEFEEQPDGAMKIVAKAGQVLKIDKEGNISVNLGGCHKFCV